MKSIILSLFDYSGNWCRPYREAGYEVIQVDIKHGIDILQWDYSAIPKKSVHGILAAIPCTDFAISGARHFADKDADGRTEQSQRLVAKTKEIIDYFQPDFWVIENPMSRIHTLNPWMGKPRQKLHPYEVAGYDPIPRDSQYQKSTWLWGAFQSMELRPMENVDGQKYWKKLGGKSERTKELRSITPLGLAYAFYTANP